MVKNGIENQVCLVFQTSQCGFAAGRRRGVASQEGQDLCAAAAAAHLIFKTRTEDQSVDLTNKDMTKDSQRLSPWFHSAWRTTGCCGVVKDLDSQELNQNVWIPHIF